VGGVGGGGGGGRGGGGGKKGGGRWLLRLWGGLVLVIFATKVGKFSFLDYGGGGKRRWLTGRAASWRTEVESAE
jgi:hypothetical protein